MSRNLVITRGDLPVCPWQDAGQEGTQARDQRPEGGRGYGPRDHLFGRGEHQGHSSGRVKQALMALRQKMLGLNSYRDELCDCSSATPFRGSQQQSSFPDEHGIEGFGSANVLKGRHHESRVHDSQAKGFQEVATRFHDEPSKQTNRDGTHLNCAEASLPVPGPGGGKRCGIQPMISKKLAANVAFLGAILMCSVRSMFTMMSDHNFMEVACSPTSCLSSRMQDLGYPIQRVNCREGFDLDRKVGTTKLRHRIAQSPPEHCWTRLSNLNHLTRRTDAEEAAFQKRQSNDLQRAYEVSPALEPVLSTGGDVSWEWPTGASAGWRSKAIRCNK